MRTRLLPEVARYFFVPPEDTGAGAGRELLTPFPVLGMPEPPPIQGVDESREEGGAGALPRCTVIAMDGAGTIAPPVRPVSGTLA